MTTTRGTITSAGIHRRIGDDEAGAGDGTWRVGDDSPAGRGVAVGAAGGDFVFVGGGWRAATGRDFVSGGLRMAGSAAGAGLTGCGSFDTAMTRSIALSAVAASNTVEDFAGGFFVAGVVADGRFAACGFFTPGGPFVAGGFFAAGGCSLRDGTAATG
ncbi:MAG TPA: hypothetical protein VEX12_10815 [Microbacterium sp.]|nr:hypothetical protein [Microbacterium sp.]